MTIEEQKAEARREKEMLAKMIFVYQSGKKYQLEQLQKMPLKKLRELRDQMRL